MHWVKLKYLMPCTTAGLSESSSWLSNKSIDSLPVQLYPNRSICIVYGHHHSYYRRIEYFFTLTICEKNRLEKEEEEEECNNFFHVLSSSFSTTSPSISLYSCKHFLLCQTFQSAFTYVFWSLILIQWLTQIYLERERERDRAER